MKTLCFTEEGHILSLELSSDQVRKLINDSGASPEPMVVLAISSKGVSAYVHASPLPYVSAVDLVADVKEPTPCTLSLRTLSPSFVSESPELSRRAKAMVPRYAEQIVTLKKIAGADVELVIPQTKTEPSQVPEAEKKK